MFVNALLAIVLGSSSLKEVFHFINNNKDRFIVLRH